MINELLGILTASGLSALIGLEREMRQQKNKNPDFGGFRTFAMLGALGYLSILLEQTFQIKGFIISAFALSFLLISISHFLDAYKNGNKGITSEFAAMSCFIVGILVAEEYIFIALFISVLFTLLLAFKDWIHNIAKKFKQEEFMAILKFLIIAGVILPILPDQIP